ncbi:MAG: hypothetical protein ACI9ON_004150 [Limisphaerales bacterium]|jgi:hypothetical protein
MPDHWHPNTLRLAYVGPLPVRWENRRADRCEDHCLAEKDPRIRRGQPNRSFFLQSEFLPRLRWDCLFVKGVKPL